MDYNAMFYSAVFIIKYHNIQFSSKLNNENYKSSTNGTLTAAVFFTLFKTRTATKIKYIYTPTIHVCDRLCGAIKNILYILHNKNRGNVQNCDKKIWFIPLICKLFFLFLFVELVFSIVFYTSYVYTRPRRRLWGAVQK